jgi:hypothetical protein
VDVERVRPTRDANEVVAVEQVKGLLDRLPKGEATATATAAAAAAAVPLFIFDAGYDPVKLQQGLEESRAQILVRLRAGRCFYADPRRPRPLSDATHATGTR